MTLPCCTLDASALLPFVLAGEDAAQWISEAGPGLKRIEFMVPEAKRPAAIPAIEKGMAALEGVTGVRVNLTGLWVAVTWRDGSLEPQASIDQLAELVTAPGPSIHAKPGLQAMSTSWRGCCGRSPSRVSPRAMSCCCRSPCGRERRLQPATCFIGSRQ